MEKQKKRYYLEGDIYFISIKVSGQKLNKKELKSFLKNFLN